MAKEFASRGDMTAKKISFTEIGRGLYAFTAEGDPNTGVIIGDDGVMVVDAQATPLMAKQVVERIRSVTDKPIRYVVYSHHHFDHIAGGRALKEAGATFIAHHRALERLTALRDPHTVLRRIMEDEPRPPRTIDACRDPVPWYGTPGLACRRRSRSWSPTSRATPPRSTR